MELDDVRKLVRLMEESGLTELEIENRSGKVRLVRGGAGRRSAARATDETVPAQEPSPSEVGAVGEVAAAEEAPAAGGPRIPEGLSAITSPMVGTFYRASAPDAPPFVSVGDVVQPGQVLCIIEAMKMMNEIHAEAAARIVSVPVENGSAVEYGSALFVVELLD